MGHAQLALAVKAYWQPGDERMRIGYVFALRALAP